MPRWTFLNLFFKAHYVGVLGERGRAQSEGLALLDSAEQFSEGFVPNYTPTINMWKFPLLPIITNTWYCQFFLTVAVLVGGLIVSSFQINQLFEWIKSQKTSFFPAAVVHLSAGCRNIHTVKDKMVAIARIHFFKWVNPDRNNLMKSEMSKGISVLSDFAGYQILVSTLK